MNAVSMEAQVSQDHHLRLRLPEDFPTGSVKVTVEAIPGEESAQGAQPSPLGRRLQALRQQALLEGMSTLTQDEVLAEVRRRRGEPIEDA